ncbi:MAG: sugar phosphate isomerase/epimerase [bacterium]|nr:sugar phosphate isomerase/epimerase [bacterium]
MTVQLCLNTSTIKPQPLLEKVRLVAEAGFAGIELWLNDIYEHVGRGGEVSDLEKAIADHGLFVPCTIAMRQWGEASELEYPIILDECKRRMELAARIGSPYIVATPPRDPCDREQLVNRYRDLLEAGRSIGVKPTFEYISFFAGARTLADAVAVVHAVADDDATLILDAFHSWNSNSPPEDLEAITPQMISHYHIDDADPNLAAGEQTDPDRVMPGDGPIDLAGEIAVLKKMGYDKTVSLELFNRELWKQDPAEVLRIGRERVAQLWEDA